MTPGTIRRKFASVRKSLMLIDPKLALGLDWPKLPTEQRTAPSGFTRNERHSILRAAEQLSPRDEAIVKLLLYTGPRATSLAEAKLSNVVINSRSGEITYDVTKTNSEYSVPLNAEVRRALSAWIDERPPVDHDHLFCAERFPHRPISRHVVYDVWHERLRRLLPKTLADRIAGPHQARHDLARRLLSGSEGSHVPVPVADAAAILGHADPRVTVSIYSQPSPEDLRRAVDRLVGDEG
jgi:integrase